MTLSSLLSIILLLVLQPQLSASAPNQGLRHTSHQISKEVFSCDSSNPIIRGICTAAHSKINQELTDAGLSIDRDGILFAYENPDDEKINTGHSCSVTADARHKWFSARLSSTSRIDLSGNSITEPLAIRLSLPVSLSGRVDVRQRFGARIFGSCKRYGSDSYSLKGSASTKATIIISMFLNPSLGDLPSGDYVLQIEPKVVVLFDLDSTSLNMRTSGVSPISAAVTFVTGLTSTIFKSVDALFSGESVSKILESSLPFDIGAPILLGSGKLPRPLEELVWKVLSHFGEHEAEKKAAKVGDDLELDLNVKVRRALKVGNDGKRRFVIPKEIASLESAGKSGADLLSVFPTDPSVACKNGVGMLCNSCRGCEMCRTQWEQCTKLTSDYASKYNTGSLVTATPRIEKLLSIAESIAVTVPPVLSTSKTVPRDSGSREDCIRDANMLCSACRGCSECSRRQLACRNS